jgi:uncharacterized membrane protein
MVGMNHAHSLLGPLAEVVVRNRFWMTWNLILATVPLALAVPLFRHRGPRGLGWWLGLGLLVLFLPNAPYVVTDLVHLRGDVVTARSDLAVVGGVLPAYAAFVAAGFVIYTLVLREAGRWLEAEGLGRWRPGMEVAVHLVCAVGVVLGRVARLNSWEPVTEPHSTVERVVSTLTWRAAPLAVAVLFVVIWAGHALVRGTGRAVEARLTATLGTWLRAGAL